MRRRTEQEPGDVLLDIVGEQPVAPSSDEVLDDVADRPRRRWPIALACVVGAAAVVVAGVRQNGDDPGRSADSPTNAARHPVVPRNQPWPEGGFTAKIPGECPTTVVCAEVETPTRVRTAIRKAVVKQLGTPRQLRITTRMRPATVSDHRSMYTRIITARVASARLKVVVSRSPIDPTSDSILAGGRADVRYESELSDYEVVGVLGVPGTLSRHMFFGLTRLVDDRVLIAGRT